MREARDRFCLTLEARGGSRIPGHLVGKNLDRDVPIESRVASPEDLTHTAAAEETEDLVGAKTGAGGQRHDVFVDDNPRMKLRIVLVEPKEGGNVGAAARVMKNFGFRDLMIVGPPPDDPDEKSVWWAVGAEDVLREARRVDRLEDALADVHLSVATTAVRGRHVYEQLTPADVARLAEETAGEEERLALVFGRETWGLTGQEIAMCQRTASVPTSPESPTMNLAQAVGVFCYELGKGLRPQAKMRDLAPGDLIQALHAHARELLADVGYFGDKSPDRMCAELQALVGRVPLTTREASLLLAIVRQVQGRIKA
jgi:tRNA/rRNA methyltransferase